MPDWIPQGPPREVVQVLVPLGQQVEHVRLDQRDADTAFPPSLIPPDAILSVVIHNSYTHTYDPGSMINAAMMEDSGSATHLRC